MGQTYLTKAATLSPNQGRVITFAVETVTDDHGTLVDPMGLDLGRYLSNPVAIWSHAGTTEEMPPPRPEDVLGRTLAIRSAPDRLEFDIEFATADVNPIADRVFRMCKAGYLNMVSLGFAILAQQGQVITRAELHEISICIVGSNPRALAVRRYITSGKDSIMDKAAFDKALGLENPNREQAEEAVMAYLTSTSDDPQQRQAMVQALNEFYPENAGEPEARAEAPEQGGDGGDEEKETMRTAVRILKARVAELEGKGGNTTEAERKQMAVRKVEGLISRGRLPASQKEEAVKDELAGRLDGALKYIGEDAALTKGAQRSGAGARVQTRSAPPKGTEGEVEEVEQAAKDDAKAALEVTRARLARNGTIARV